jgi:predicted secreted Zn-dependent protease
MVRCSVGILVAAFLVSGVMPTNARADPQITERFEYYDVDGMTADEIRADLNRRGPTDSVERRHFDAVTHWHVRWRYTYTQGGRSCKIKSVSTVVQVTYLFPRLADPTSAPADLRLAFSQYLERLLVHEKGHAQNGIDIAARIEDRIRHLPPAATCTALGEIANESGHALIKEAIQRDVDYDAETQHGKTQGARFPRDNLPMGGGRGSD